MTIGNIIGAIIIMVGGFAMALFLFIFENIASTTGFGGWLMNAYNYRVEEEDALLY